MTLVELAAGMGTMGTAFITVATDVVELITSNPILFIGTLTGLVLTGVGVAKRLFR